MPSLSVADRIAVLELGDGENRLNHEYLADVSAVLDEIEVGAGDRFDGLVYRGGGSAFCLGFDLDAVGGEVARVSEFVPAFQQLIVRLTTFSLPTIAAVNGHAIAAGAVLALAADERVMRADRGWFSLPEVDLGAGFTPFLVDFLRLKLSVGTLNRATLTGRRYGGHDAVDGGIAASAHPLDELGDAAIELCASRGPKVPAHLARIKGGIFRELIERVVLEPSASEPTVTP